MSDIPTETTSTAVKWLYDPENISANDRAPEKKKKSFQAAVNALTGKGKDKDEARRPWLANIRDADGNSKDHPDYNPRTVFVPAYAWKELSPFETQYWEIKKNLWDTVVFFKKGKFYELYENDATLGHQLFDLKLTDRVNMRMVGVPESSLDTWVNQFIAKGYKVARVDQMESALGKEIRERDGAAPPKKGKEDKIIRRELKTILTKGTLVDQAMLQDDMATYCMAIKELSSDDEPEFGIAFVDTSTAQFQVVQFKDDTTMTKFETLIAQTRPQELLLEKGSISAKALRILKNNTSLSTIWNYLTPTKEFLPADIACREIEAADYFKDHENKAWPPVLQTIKEKELVMSAYGALLHYLQVLMIDRELISLGNISWYDPIRKATSLILDGQSLINLEIFANTSDGGVEGTLFQMLNKCITPFGKRMLRQWVCHPLADSRKINARLDAVDSLRQSTQIVENFTGTLTKLPDLERLISRVHAGTCKVADFIRVLEGFEQIEYLMSLLDDIPKGDGIIGQLLDSMPDLTPKLKSWKSAFDRKQARDQGILVPEAGVEEEFDESQQRLENCKTDLADYLDTIKKQLKSSSIVYRDIGKEIYQLEIPSKISGIPKGWSKMSGTKAVSRYYTPELRKMVREVQETEELHGQVLKSVARKFFARFDEDYSDWLAAVKVVAQLDCLISLTITSMSLETPSCRPEFIDAERTTLEFTELRHPCMLSADQFIPNDIHLGGTSPNIDLLTGANAAGKSTVLRMTCIAVIMAQIGCYVPARSATISPVDRIMSRLGAQDNIFAAQSTFFVELLETQKILADATPRSLVILDELGRGTSSYDGVAVAQAVLHDVATRIGCVGFFATHYHSLAVEFRDHPEVRCVRMRIAVDSGSRSVTFLYELEDGIAEGSFGMHCAHMCGIPEKVIERAEVAAKEWEHTSRLRESLEKAKGRSYVPLGMMSDVGAIMKGAISERELAVLRKAIAAL
jgi:DNA mismatch repair protein MSH6